MPDDQQPDAFTPDGPHGGRPSHLRRRHRGAGGPADPPAEPARPGSADEPPAPDTATGGERATAESTATCAEDGGSGRGHRSGRGVLREAAIVIVTALVLSFLVQTFLARVYLIPSESMENTLHGCAGCTGDRIVVDKVVYHFGAPERGDVLVFRGPPSWDDEFTSNRSSNVLVRGFQTLGAYVGLYPPDENDLVKRVIAVGGQTVRCRAGDPGVMVDGRAIDEPYRRPVPAGTAYPNGSEACGGPYFGPITVPAGRLWMMGDNRTNSRDSRFHMDDEFQGTVGEGDVIGKVRFIILPFSRIGGVS